MLDTSFLPTDVHKIRKESILSCIERTKKRAIIALTQGRNFNFPSVKEILGEPPKIATSNADDILESAKELSSYYALASHIEGEFSKFLKEKRA